MVTIDSENFKDDTLQAGHVYFINMQLLGKDKLLTKEPGDKRNSTFWQTVAKTIARAPQDFVLIIDEAHRGATATDRNRTPIMQKFILGSVADGLPPVPLVLGTHGSLASAFAKLRRDKPTLGSFSGAPSAHLNS